MAHACGPRAAGGAAAHYCSTSTQAAGIDGAAATQAASVGAYSIGAGVGAYPIGAGVGIGAVGRTQVDECMQQLHPWLPQGGVGPTCLRRVRQ